MFKLTQDDIKALIERHTWGTIVTVNDDGTPYAIECTFFLINGDICSLINPHGTTARNIARDNRVLFKVCESDALSRQYQAASYYGKAEYVQDKDVLSNAWDVLEQRLNLEPGTYGVHKAKFVDPTKKSPLFRLKIEKITGRGNWGNKKGDIS